MDHTSVIIKHLNRASIHAWLNGEDDNLKQEDSLVQTTQSASKSGSYTERVAVRQSKLKETRCEVHAGSKKAKTVSGNKIVCNTIHAKK